MKVVYSIGTSTRSMDEFMAILRQYGISSVIDVRRFPKSRFEHFSKDNLRAHLERHDVRYIDMGNELGGFRRGGYEKFMKTSAFKEAIELLEKLAAESTCVITCSERFPWKCHRRFVARAFEERGWDVIHVIESDRVWRPRREHF